MMFEDHIVNEVREIRRKHSARYDNDLDKIVAALQKRESKIKNFVQPMQSNCDSSNSSK